MFTLLLDNRRDDGDTAGGSQEVFGVASADATGCSHNCHYSAGSKVQ